MEDDEGSFISKGCNIREATFIEIANLNFILY